MEKSEAQMFLSTTARDTSHASKLHAQVDDFY